jgi:endo-1,4-beta-xylanase
MKHGYPAKKTTYTRYFALLVMLLSVSFFACKSSMEEDLTPITVEKTTPAALPAENASAPADTTAAGGNANSTDTTTKSTTPAAPVVPAIPAATTPTSGNTNIPANATLKGTFSFPIGAAIDMDRLKGTTYSNVVSTQFSSITAESSMKFGAVHPSLNVFDFKKADAIIAFAANNNMRVHGHTLLWPKDSLQPSWVMNFQGDKAAWDNLLKTHIQTVVKHFKGKVASWDVVNEAYADNGTLKDNIWLRKIGPEYITKAFIYAHEADPNALLFLNDYGQEFGGKKMAAILAFVADAKKTGMTIDGLGFQMHTVVRLDVSGLKTNLAKAAATGLKIHFSELDISVRYQKAENFILDEALATLQALKFKEIVKIYMSIPKAQQFGITTWGVSDGDSNLNYNVPNNDHDYPLLFDKNYNPKLAFKAVIEAGLGK